MGYSGWHKPMAHLTEWDRVLSESHGGGPEGIPIKVIWISLLKKIIMDAGWANA